MHVVQGRFASLAAVFISTRLIVRGGPLTISVWCGSFVSSVQMSMQGKHNAPASSSGTAIPREHPDIMRSISRNQQELSIAPDDMPVTSEIAGEKLKSQDAVRSRGKTKDGRTYCVPLQRYLALLGAGGCG